MTSKRPEMVIVVELTAARAAYRECGVLWQGALPRNCEDGDAAKAARTALGRPVPAVHACSAHRRTSRVFPRHRRLDAALDLDRLHARLARHRCKMRRRR